MKRILPYFFLLNITFYNGQTTKNVFVISGLYGQILSNNLVGTSWNYNKHNAFSGVNLKCTSVIGMQLQFKHLIKNSKWFYLIDYGRHWINYSTTLYSMNFNPNTEFNHIKELSYNTTVETFSAGGGKRFSIPNSRLSFDLSAALSYHLYQDKRIGSLCPIDYWKTTELETGDFNYFVELNFTKYARKLKFSAQSSLNFFINQRLDFNFILAFSNPIIGEYSYENLTRGNDEVIIPGEIIVTHMESGSFSTLGRVATKYLSCGVGLNFKI